MYQEKSFKVGDVVVIYPRYIKAFSVKIERLTKTQAIGKSGSGNEYKFARMYVEHCDNNKVYYHVRRVPRADFVWDTNNYEVISR